MGIHIGIDNGPSGSVGIIIDHGQMTLAHTVAYFRVPILRTLDYTKKKRFVSRLEANDLRETFERYTVTPGSTYPILIERPMVNPKMFRATLSAVRFLEATITMLEGMRLSYQFVDSKEWQFGLLPSGLRGPELKTASLAVGKRLFPGVNFHGFKDADGLLLAEYSRRKNSAQNHQNDDKETKK